MYLSLFLYRQQNSTVIGFTADILRTNTGVTSDGFVPLSVTASQVHEWACTAQELWNKLIYIEAAIVNVIHWFVSLMCKAHTGAHLLFLIRIFLIIFIIIIKFRRITHAVAHIHKTYIQMCRIIRNGVLWLLVTINETVFAKIAKNKK